MEKQARRSGWLLREEYKYALRSNLSEGESVSLLKISPDFCAYKNVFYSFGIAQICRRLEEHVEEGLLTKLTARSVAMNVLEWGIETSNNAIKADPELAREIASDPKVPLERRTVLREELKGGMKDEGTGSCIGLYIKGRRTTMMLIAGK